MNLSLTCYSHVKIYVFRFYVETKFCSRTDTFDPVCFLYAFLSHISKVETVNRTLLQTDNFFSPQIKKPPALPGHK